MKTGLDVLVAERFDRFKGKRLGVLCHQASVAADLVHIVDHLVGSGCTVARVFGPQHGPWGHTQDDMVEWSGYTDLRTGLEFASLYGAHRRPTTEMLAGLDRFVVDLQDVGCRVYTFVWTMALCLEACAEAGLPVTVLDRPNPIDGDQEGPVLQPGYESFVGLHPLPMRHGMTIGQVAQWLVRRRGVQVELEVVPREPSLGDPPWVMPSPNMPTLDTARVYPGMVLLEGTNVSEGRGTTRPFETFGAPWLDGWRLCADLNESGLPGVRFRPVAFQPTFHKHVGEVCQGGFVHVTDPSRFRPVATGFAVLLACHAQAPDAFAWKSPPYEYETQKWPIDVLAGNSWVREGVEGRALWAELAERADEELATFRACQV